VAVQVVTKAHGEITDIEHVGSARTDAELALLLHAARELLHPGQGELDLGPVQEAPVSVEDVADWTRREEAGLFPARGAGEGLGRPAAVAGGGRVVGTASLLLWQVLEAAYARLGFDAVDDEAFKALVLGRVMSPPRRRTPCGCWPTSARRRRRCAPCSGPWPAASRPTTAAGSRRRAWRTRRGPRPGKCR
jgi:hypothetical protein